MLTAMDFQGLTDDLKIYVLLSYGSYTADRKYGIYCIQLFAVDGFFVEVFYLPGSDEIDQILAVESPDVLDYYLNNIDISDIFFESA